MATTGVEFKLLREPNIDTVTTGPSRFHPASNEPTDPYGLPEIVIHFLVGRAAINGTIRTLYYW